MRSADGLDEDSWIEQLRQLNLSVGTYVITSGEVNLVSPDDSIQVGPGSVVFVPANDQHRFEQISGTLLALVPFGPPSTAEPPTERPDLNESG